MKANSDKSKQSNKATHRVLAGVLCGTSVLSLVLSLVMPPISQAIANDAQTVSAEETVMGGGSSSESTDVGNTTGGDAENPDSNDIAGDDTSDDADVAGLSSDGTGAEDAEQSSDDSAGGEGAIALTAENESAYEIRSGEELQTKLSNENLRDGNGSATFKLVDDIECNQEIRFEKAVKITLDLNGHKIKCSSADKPLFDVANGATLTIKDSAQANETVSEGQQLTDQGQSLNPDNYGKKAELAYDGNGIPSRLTYYVTESSSTGTGTTETLVKRSVDIKGAIVACGGNANLKLINLYNNNGKGGTFNLESGVVTQQNSCQVSSLIYAENSSTVNMGGGYVCGASSSGAGGGIEIKNNATLSVSGGVIAGNSAPSGGGVYANGSTVNVDGGIISGNGTFDSQSGYGAGICALGSTVSVKSGYITNNKYQFYRDTDSTGWKHLGFGCHGGGGIAAYNGGSLTIEGGYITGNYSAEAGGGIYAGAWNQALGNFKFSGGTIASNVAENSEGGGIRIAAPTVGVFEVPKGSHAYITNNTTNTTNDWGGGGVFVQGGNSGEGVSSARLKIYNALITKNSAMGYGGGFAACPSGKTAITDTDGIAIFGNTDRNGINLSGGTNGKKEDQPTSKEGAITDDFKKHGHEDLFLIRNSKNTEYIAAVTGQMLGGGAANWSGTIDNQPTTIGKYDGAQAKYMIGLKSGPSIEDQNAAKGLASLYITGNSSNIHGGGIMTNGDVVAGSTTQVSVYPKMKLTGSKALEGRTLKNKEFEFELLKRDSDAQAPSFAADGTLQLNGCSVVDTALNNADGSFTFDLGEVYADANLVYYLVEKPGTDKGITYSTAIYTIVPAVTMDKSHDVLGIRYTYYKVDSVKVTKTAGGSASESTVYPTTNGDVVSIQLTSDATFTNNVYNSEGSWTPVATKVVEGGEMKEFTLEFADNADFKNAKTVVTDPKGKITTTADGDKSQTLSFDEIKYDLGSLKQSDSDVPGRGASKTFTYYVREKTDGSSFSHYTYDKSVYRFDVTMTDNKNGSIEARNVTYTKIKDADGNKIDETDQKPVTFDGSGSTPTFTNTYSTSLPLSGMSGVTLTYFAGAAVLCVAAAWMHVRRKASAKGGERRE